ncbi:MAG: 50S ribosomal protein L10 [Sphingobacteriales bacterium]|nr:MAG: 50S ribosomal protein L10 [Sphingobacteriales bacterium]
MRRENKEEIVAALSETLTASRNFYVADISTLTVNQTNALRRLCFERGVTLQVVKNTLIEKALEKANIQADGLVESLKGPSSIMFAENSKSPAKLIKEFRAANPKPLLKAAYIEESLYVGDENLDMLITLKSREELIADVVAILQSPIKNVVSGLKSGGSKIAGILKTLSEKTEA